MAQTSARCGCIYAMQFVFIIMRNVYLPKIHDQPFVKGVRKPYQALNFLFRYGKYGNFIDL